MPIGQDKPPTLAQDKTQKYNTLSQSLAFHASPHDFLTGRGQAVGDDRDPPAVAANILNRNVAIFGSHRQCTRILNAHDAEGEDTADAAEAGIEPAAPGQKLGERTFTALPAYKQLMEDFFPRPNLLLLDAPEHSHRRGWWDGHMANVCLNAQAQLDGIAVQEISTWKSGITFDIYYKMKDVAWKMLLGVFLGLEPTDPLYSKIVRWQEDLLRGQFSLFPVSINTPFWSSARSRGLNARKKLQPTLKDRLKTIRGGCPFVQESSPIEEDEMASNVLLFTSSIAAKSLASLMTASLLNIFLFPCQPSLAEQFRQTESHQREALMQSILTETERLSPPVVGIMRRLEQDAVVQQSGTDSQDTKVLIPNGWDVWLYFVGANRNERAYPDAGSFHPRRFLETRDHGTPPPPLAFGSGVKTCLGKNLVRKMITAVATAAIDAGIELHGSVNAEGVRSWLGWDATAGDAIQRDMKQLPCQRPREPIRVRVSKTNK